MVLNKVAYVQAQGLPATPSGRSYVLWRISGQGQAVPIAAVHTRPTQGPIKAGAMPVPITDVSRFALSVEAGDVVPAAPTDVIAEGTVA
jgi:anti-sigma-K factor RskA